MFSLIEDVLWGVVHLIIEVTIGDLAFEYKEGVAEPHLIGAVHPGRPCVRSRQSAIVSHGETVPCDITLLNTVDHLIEVFLVEESWGMFWVQRGEQLKELVTNQGIGP